ncbi:unnamed protein product [Knipowitschia caucasica]
MSKRICEAGLRWDSLLKECMPLDMRQRRPTTTDTHGRCGADSRGSAGSVAPGAAGSSGLHPDSAPLALLIQKTLTTFDWGGTSRARTSQKRPTSHKLQPGPMWPMSHWATHWAPHWVPHWVPHGPCMALRRRRSQPDGA